MPRSSSNRFASSSLRAVVTTLMASPIFERLVGTGSYQPVAEPAPEARTRQELG